jgi:hypothetical protein
MVLFFSLQLSVLGPLRTKTKTNGSLGPIELDRITQLQSRQREQSTSGYSDDEDSSYDNSTLDDSDSSGSSYERQQISNRRGVGGRRNKGYAASPVEQLDATRLHKQQRQLQLVQQPRRKLRSSAKKANSCIRPVTVAGGGGGTFQMHHSKQGSSVSVHAIERYFSALQTKISYV